MNIDNPRINKGLTEISRVKQLTEGINSNEWIEKQLMSRNQSYEIINIEENQVQEKSQIILGKMVSIPYSFTNQQNQNIPYIIFRYLMTQLSNESLAFYYELNADEPEDKNQQQLKATQAIIKIITSRYIFIVIANKIPDFDDSTTGGIVDIIEVRGNRNTIYGFVTHPLEIIKTAIIRTNSWSLELESKNNHNINLEEEYREFDKWFNCLSRGKIADLIALCNESEKDNREGMRIDICVYGDESLKVLKSLYDYTINRPRSFKTTNNCIGFRWEIEQEEKTYNFIIDRDFNYIYIFKNGYWSV